MSTSGGLREQLRIILWLQRRLLANALRRGQTRGISHVLGLALVMLFSIPYICGGSVGLGVYLRSVSPDRAVQLLTVGGTFFLFAWVASPTSSQQLLESPNLPRLLHHPLTLPALVLGGIMTSSLSLIAFFTIPFLLAIPLGASPNPTAFLQIVLSTVVVYVFLVTVRAAVGGVFDLVAEDRRTRGRLAMLVVLPIMLLYLSQIGLQNIGREEALPFSGALASSGRLVWLPTGWFASSVGAAMRGDGRQWLTLVTALVLVASVGFVVHYRLQLRLYFGDIRRTGPSGGGETGILRDRTRLPGLSATDSATFRALLAKDIRNLRRSPMTPRMAFVPLMFALMTFFITRNSQMPGLMAAIGAGGVAAFSVTSLAMNGLAVLDHRGLGALLLSPVPRRLVLLSHGVLNVLLAVTIGAFLGIVVALATGSVLAVPIAVGTALLAQVCFNGIAHLGSIYFAYYVDLERGRSSANEASLLAAMLLLVGLPIVVAPAFLIGVTAYFVGEQWLPAGVVLVYAYAIGLYIALLGVSSAAFVRREERLLQEIVEGR